MLSSLNKLLLDMITQQQKKILSILKRLTTNVNVARYSRKCDEM